MSTYYRNNGVAFKRSLADASVKRRLSILAIMSLQGSKKLKGIIVCDDIVQLNMAAKTEARSGVVGARSHCRNVRAPALRND